uniref:DUF4283 domain-containing protein n=1 Tax=Panagrellus redivivus TaxID=6233 RepID=A0A7E4UUD0_PANRE
MSDLVSSSDVFGRLKQFDHKLVLHKAHYLQVWESNSDNVRLGIIFQWIRRTEMVKNSFNKLIQCPTWDHLPMYSED